MPTCFFFSSRGSNEALSIEMLRFRFRKLALGICVALFLFIAFSLSPKVSLGLPPSLPQQRRIKEVLNRGTNVPPNPVTIQSSIYMRPKVKEETFYRSNYSLPFLEIPKVAQKQPKNNVEEAAGINESKLLEMVELNLLSMQRQGTMLTKEQKKHLASISPEREAVMKKHIGKMTKVQEKAYQRNLRKKGTIQPLPSGGERIVAKPSSSVKIPRVLSFTKPEDWNEVYKIYLNLTYFPWPDTPSCESYYTVFAPPGSLRTMALASFPSSGNTWVRYLIDSTGGIFTGSKYDDFSLLRKGLYGEGVLFDSGMSIVQKTHGIITGRDVTCSPYKIGEKLHMVEMFNNQGIILIRNPFKALISHRHLDSGGHTGYAPSAHFRGTGWNEFVMLKICLWKSFYLEWLDESRPQDIYVVHYETLKENYLEVLRGILKFLHLSVDKHRFDCLAKHPNGPFMRKPSKNLQNTSGLFSKEMKKAIYEAIHAVNEALVQRGKEPLPVQLYEFYEVHEAEMVKQKLFL